MVVRVQPHKPFYIIALLHRMNQNQPFERATKRWSDMERPFESGILSSSSQAHERRLHLMWPRSLPSGRTLNQVPPVLEFDLALVSPCFWHSLPSTHPGSICYRGLQTDGLVA